MSDRPQAQVGEATAVEVRLINDIFDGLATGFNDNDAAGLDGAFTDDVVLIAPDGNRVQGWQNLHTYHRSRLSGPARDWRTRYSVLDITIIGDGVAVVHTRQDTRTPDRQIANLATCVLISRHGQWWIAAMHSAPVDPQDS